MKVIEIKSEEGKRYMLLNRVGEPVIPVVKYLKYLSNIGRSGNTIKSYAYHLKLYFEFLEVENVEYQQINLHTLSSFIGWLRRAYQASNVIPLEEKRRTRSEKTINIILNCVFGFYKFYERNDEYLRISNMMTTIPANYSTFKPFLHHISKKGEIDTNILKQKETKQPIKTLQHSEIIILNQACSNIRDRLILRLLYEGGLRIGEAVNLWIEDININECSIRVRKSKTRAGQGRKVYVSKETINLFQDYIIDFHVGDIDTNYLFYNLSGPNKGKPFSTQGMRSVVKRIRKKTGIYFTPHMFRHTFATELHENGVDISMIQKLLGHSHVQTTMQVYMHPSDKVIRESYERAQTEINNRRVINETTENK